MIFNLDLWYGLETSISLTISEPKDQIIIQCNFANQMIIYLITRDQNSEKKLADLVGWIFVVWSSSSIYSLPLLLATKAPFYYLQKGWGVRYMTQDEPISTSFHMSQFGVRQNPKWALRPKRSQSRALLKAIRKLDFLSARLEWKRIMELKLPQPSCEHKLREVCY